MQSGSFLSNLFFLFTRARLFCTHVHSGANTHTSPLDGFCIPKARLLAECCPTRDTIAFELGNYTSTHCFVLPRRVSHLYFSRFLAIVYPSHARVRIIETTERGGVYKLRTWLGSYMHARVKTKVENTIIVVMKLQRLFKIGDNKM